MNEEKIKEILDENQNPQQQIKQQKKSFWNNKKTVKGKALSAWLIVIVIVFMLITFGLGMYLGKEVFNNNQKSNEVSENIEKPDEKVKFNNVSEYEAKVIMKRMKEVKISSERLFSNDKFDIKDINVTEMLVTALSHIDVYNLCSKSGLDDVSLYYINSELNKYVDKQLSLDDLKSVENSEFGIGNPYDFSYSIKVESDKNIKVSDHVCGGLFSEEDFIKNNIIDANRENEYVYIYTKEAFARYSNESNESVSKLNYYDNYNRSGNIIQTLPSPEYGELTSDKIPNWDLYKTYKYTFKLINDEYYFQSVEVVK